MKRSKDPHELSCRYLFRVDFIMKNRYMRLAMVKEKTASHRDLAGTGQLNPVCPLKMPCKPKKYRKVDVVSPKQTSTNQP
jgi:hypothetical protein